MHENIDFSTSFKCVNNSQNILIICYKCHISSLVSVGRKVAEILGSDEGGVLADVWV